jgi:hypothetical protein
MNPAKIFTSRNNVIALIIALLCGIGIRHGIANGQKRDSAHNELSEWIDKDFDGATDATLVLEMTTAFTRLSDAQGSGDKENESIAQAMIDELKEVDAERNSDQNHSAVLNLLWAKSGKMDKLTFTQPKHRIPLWSIIGICGFFVILSSLRFALK